ncbi:MAG: VWA domain-containing protein [Campylobacteraceae bacterium]|jgi:hypothetical protein|nr:VWA domain-containing protein [Campylobacteraceae bacterium]
MYDHIQISRKTPVAFLFLVDQSESMGYLMPSINKPKAKHVADVINRTILNLIDLCNKIDGVRDYFHVGVLSYNGKGVENSLLRDAVRGVLNPISLIAENSVGEESIVEKVDNGYGKTVEREVRFPIWVEAEANGETPMCAAFSEAKEALWSWSREHHESFPPILIHITDGDSTDGNPELLAEEIKNIGTSRGNTSIFNIHVSSFASDVIKYPTKDMDIKDDYARQLFRMSSLLPAYLVQKALQRGYDVSSSSKCFVFNADAADIINFFEIGTLPATQSMA